MKTLYTGLALGAALMAAAGAPLGAQRAVPAAQAVPVRGDGAVITVTPSSPRNARVAADCYGPRGCGPHFAEDVVQAALPRSVTSYTLAELEAVAEEAKGQNARLAVKICWKGKARTWCSTLAND